MAMGANGRTDRNIGNVRATSQSDGDRIELMFKYPYTVDDAVRAIGIVLGGYGVITENGNAMVVKPKHPLWDIDIQTATSSTWQRWGEYDARQDTSPF